MGSMVLVYMVTFTINIPQMLAYIYIYHTWILWEIIQILEFGALKAYFKPNRLGIPQKPWHKSWDLVFIRPTGSEINLQFTLFRNCRAWATEWLQSPWRSTETIPAGLGIAAWHHFKKSTHFKISRSFDPHPWEIATPPRFSPVLVRTRTFDPVDTMVDCLVLHAAEISARFALKIWVRSGVFLQMWQFLPFSRCIVANHCCHVHHFEPKIPNNSCFGDVLFKLLPSGRSLWEWKSHL